MNILYLCADAGISIRGHKGASVHIRAIVNAFAALGHRVTLLAPQVGHDDRVPVAARTVEVPPIAQEASDSTAEQRERRAREIGESVYRLGCRLSGEERFDFIYERYSLWSDAGARLSDTSGLPLVAEVNSPLRIEAARYRTLIDQTEAARIEAQMIKHATAISVVSRALRDYVVRQGAEREQVWILPNGVDEHLFHPGVNGLAVRSELGLTDKFVIGFVGTARPWHDLDTLLAAVELLHASENRARPYHLLLVGNFPDELRKTIAQRGLADTVTCVGPIPHPAVPEYIAAMDVAVSPHPPLEDFYFSPLKLVEYMACGVAAVASDLPSIAQVAADGETALLYPPGDAAALAGCIAHLAANEKLCDEMGWQAASHVLQNHTWKRSAQQITSWIAPPATSNGGTVDQNLPLFDDRLGRHLFRATRADIAGPLLTRHLGEHRGSVDALSILKYKPCRRCVIEYKLVGDGGSRSIIGKVFKDHRGREQFTLQKRVWASGFGAESPDGLTVAEPLAYIPEMRMLVQECAPGLALDQLLERRDLLPRVRASAHLISKFHANSAVQPDRQYTLEQELAGLDRWASDLALWRPEHATAFDRQVARLRRCAADLPQVRLVPVHRDFYYAQVLFEGRRATLIDLDLISLADPAIDVANFAVHLCFLALQHFSDVHALDAAAAFFKREYAIRSARRCNADSPMLQPRFDQRVDFYSAATWFRLMHVALDRPHLTSYFEPLFDVNEEISTARH